MRLPRLHWMYTTQVGTDVAGNAFVLVLRHGHRRDQVLGADGVWAGYQAFDLLSPTLYKKGVIRYA